MSANATTAEQAGVADHTPLHALHLRLGGKMVPFAGFELPVSYSGGIIHEHTHTRTEAGLFDVSHMGQAFLVGPDHGQVADVLETLCAGSIRELAPGRQRYTQLLNDDGGIVDDLMVTRSASRGDDGRLMLIVNAACKHVDYALISAHLPSGFALEEAEDRALLALQGPKAAEVLARHCPEAGSLGFMAAASARFDAIDCHISRSGYTGEDGYEISVAAGDAMHMAEALLAQPEVEPIGLGARDSLRLEAGLCLYGADIDETTSPVEADLAWSIGKRRREQGGFPGAERILAELREGPARRRVGLVPEGRAPVRGGQMIEDGSGREIGVVTSGLYGPSLAAPIAMGYVEAGSAAPGTGVSVLARGTARRATVTVMPFVAHRYHRAGT